MKNWNCPVGPTVGRYGIAHTLSYRNFVNYFLSFLTILFWLSTASALELSQELAEACPPTKISFSVPSGSMRTVLSKIAELSDCNLAMLIERDSPATVTAVSQPWNETLLNAIRNSSLKIRIVGPVILIYSPEYNGFIESLGQKQFNARLVSFELKDTPLPSVVQLFRTAAKITIEFKAPKRRSVTLKLSQIPADLAAEIVRAQVEGPGT